MLSTVVIIGNIIAFVASIFMVVAGMLNDRKKILVVQTLQMALFIASNIVLKGYTAAVINAISIIRNMLAYKDKLSDKLTYLLLGLTIIISILVNNNAIIGLLPLIGTVVFTLNINNKNITKLKLALSLNMFLWFIFDLYIKSFTSAIFDFLSMAAGLITVYQIKMKKEIIKS